MELHACKKAILEASQKLVKTGLIARTWGNISCRISETQFAITPSGKAYDSLTDEDIVVVNIADLSYDSPIKPSSEKGIHAEVYKLKPDIGFVIHTHQAHASAASVLGTNIRIFDEEVQNVIGERVECAAYGLPGTKRLRNGVIQALKRSQSKAVLLSHHGALCFGRDCEEAFTVAHLLEKECKRFLVHTEQSQSPSVLLRSYRTEDAFVLECEDKEMQVDGAVDIDIDRPSYARLHEAIYKARPDINVIIGSALPFITVASKLSSDIKPLLDDFAQIIGASAAHAAWDENNVRKSTHKIVHALKSRNAVFIKDVGALCCAGSDSDAVAVEMVLEKGCMAYLSASEIGRVLPIAKIDCALMRYVYLHKYSKMGAPLKKSGEKQRFNSTKAK